VASVTSVPRLETLFLDAGGVLVFPNWARVSDTLRHHGVTVSADVLAAAEPRAKFVIDQSVRHGDATDTQRMWRFMELVFESAGVAPGPASDAAVRDLHVYHAAHNLWESVPTDVVPALARLAGLGLKLVVVSNANGALHRMFDRVGLTRYFHCICDSCVEGVEKPDPRFFQIALERAGAAAESTMHVGDLYYVDVEGARASGIQPMLIDPFGLYAEFEVDRVQTLGQLADRLSERTNR
jgi:putative hydrolase of the HAD superfamily